MRNPLNGWANTPALPRGTSNYTISHPPTDPGSVHYSTFNHLCTFTDMVVNFGPAAIRSPPTQTVEGRLVFNTVTYIFPATEDDPTIRGGTSNLQNLALVVEASHGTWNKLRTFFALYENIVPPPLVPLRVVGSK